MRDLGAGGCSVKWIEEFGYMTIPTLAATAFALAGVLLALATADEQLPGGESSDG